MSPLLAKRLSDETLGSRLASGEAAAFDELYRRYVHRLAAYGAHLLGDGAAGDDVAQATMLKVYGTLRDGRVPERMKPWLYRIAHNVAIDLVVRRREWPTAELPERSGSDTAPIAGALVAALVALPERQRRVYVLRELHGLRIDETAAELSLSATQVEQSLFAARNRLAEHLVFGDRLTCVSVQRLAAGPLDRDERRALKSHLRSCPSCRSSLGLRGRALSTPPVSLEWLRGLLSGALGGGAPVVAKVGAAVATVSFAAGVPAAVETVPVHPPPFRVPVRAAPIAHARVTARTRVTRARPAVATVAFSRTSVGGHTSRRGRGGGSDDRSSVSSSTASARSGDDVRARSSDTGSSHEGPAGGELPVVASSSGGSGSDGGGSNAASQQSGGGPGPSTTTVTTVVVATPTPTGDGGPGSGVGSGSGISGSGGSDQAVRSGSDGGGSIDGRDGGGGGDDGKDGGGGDGGGYPLTGR